MEIGTKFIQNIKGFLDHEEGKILYNIAMKSSNLGPCLEIGSYCGKSAVYIGTACKKKSTVLFSIDHHQGSEEHQFGEKYYDPNLFKHNRFTLNTLNLFIGNILKTKLDDTIIPIISKSETVARAWTTKLGMIFIDGSHSYNDVLSDYKCWYKHIYPGGYLIFHDIFKNPNDGGQAPYKIYKLATESGKFSKYKIIKTLGILQTRG